MVSRMEVLPPPSPSSATSPGSPIAPAVPTTTTTGAAADTSDRNTGNAVRWATLPNGPVVHDEAASAGVQVALPGSGDTYTCCFAASGDADRPAPLGRLRVTWRPEGTEAGGAEGGGVTPSVPVGQGGAAAGGGSVGEAVTDFPLPVLSARPPALSARLKAPPHARVGEQFTMRWGEQLAKGRGRKRKFVLVRGRCEGAFAEGLESGTPLVACGKA